MNEKRLVQDAPLRWYHYLFVGFQYLLPHHLLSAFMHHVTRLGWAPLKNLIIQRFIHLYGVDMGLAQESDPRAYPSFNAFFTRALKPGVRPVAAETDTIACPADGRLSQADRIANDSILQAKGHSYSLAELLGGSREWSALFQDGSFATVYLSPRDYHRVHMPFAGRLRKMLHVPGRLFSVSPVTSRLVPGLFARNERVVCLFETPIGPLAVILVGAIFVASIDTAWAGTVTPASGRVASWDYEPNADQPVQLAKGAEMGRFNMGSTVILLFAKSAVEWSDELQSGNHLQMGQPIGRVIKT